jgi:hypothetical protein
VCGGQKETRQAVLALSNIAVSGDVKDMGLATNALGVVFRNYKSSVVKISANLGGLQSGTIVTNSGHVLTSGYLAPSKEDQYAMEMWDGTKLNAALLGRDESEKLALLKMNGEADYRPLHLASEIPATGEQVIAIGFIAGKLSAAVGTVGGFVDDFIEVVFEQRTELAGAGGGPILNARGEVIGIVYASGPDVEHCVRSDKVIKYLDSKGIRDYQNGSEAEGVEVEMSFATTLELKFFWGRLPLTLKDELVRNRRSMYEYWSERQAGQMAFPKGEFNMVALPIQHQDRNFTVTYTVREGLIRNDGRRIAELWILHIH